MRATKIVTSKGKEKDCMDYSPLENLNLWQTYVSLGVVFLFFVLIDIFFFRLFIRAFPRFVILACEILLFASWVFGLIFPTIVFGIALAVAVICFYSANVSEARALSGNNLKGKSTAKRIFTIRKKPKGEALFDREAMYKQIQTAVFAMSDSKTGALLTFEKNDNLDDIIKRSGTIINCPVTPEIIQTIFYTGTRLHDGAIVIRNNVIVAASVYYTPTNKPLQGKFGSRHRAAIGISELVDAVTIVVSEETGRISFAVKGELTPVNKEKFLEEFASLMAYTPEQKKK